MGQQSFLKIGQELFSESAKSLQNIHTIHEKPIISPTRRIALVNEQILRKIGCVLRKSIEGCWLCKNSPDIKIKKIRKRDKSVKDSQERKKNFKLREKTIMLLLFKSNIKFHCPINARLEQSKKEDYLKKKIPLKKTEDRLNIWENIKYVKKIKLYITWPNSYFIIYLPFFFFTFIIKNLLPNPTINLISDSSNTINFISDILRYSRFLLSTQPAHTKEVNFKLSQEIANQSSCGSLVSWEDFSKSEGYQLYVTG